LRADTFRERLNQAERQQAEQKDSLPRFDLNFPGGTPGDLVRAIEKAMQKPLNAIIPEEYANIKLPTMSVKNVNVPELFEALRISSIKSVAYITGVTPSPMSGGNARQGYSYRLSETSFGFKTAGNPGENSIWIFYEEKPALPPEALSRIPLSCRFYQLSPYLESGYTVEDITTAIETGWKMLNETNAPNISYHKDTKLLIAVGESEQLSLIQDVLSQLALPKEKAANKTNAEKPKDQ